MANNNFITIAPQNLEQEHICCAFSDKKSLNGYQLKKEWIAEQLKNGFVFRKLNQKAKVFIEYVEGQHAWQPVMAEGYLAIGCFWVSGSYTGKGYARELLNSCLSDAEGLNGVYVISSDKKRPFLADKKFFLKHGFEVCDTAPPYFELLAKRNSKTAPLPTFNESCRSGRIPNGKGMDVFHSARCPYTDFYVDEIGRAAAELGIEFYSHRVSTVSQAQNNPSPHTIFSLYRDGEFVTHEILSRNKFLKLFG